MTEQDFRTFLNGANANNELLFVQRSDGSKAIAVGLNGGKIVLHRGGEIPLDHIVSADWDVLYEKRD